MNEREEINAAHDDPGEGAEDADAVVTDEEIERLRSLAEERDDVFARLQRAKADLVNYRSRVGRELTEVRRFALQGFITELLNVVDDFDRAIDAAQVSGGSETLDYDNIVISQRFGERAANDDIFAEIEKKVPEVHKIGDCSSIKGIMEAIHGANDVARQI